MKRIIKNSNEILSFIQNLKSILKGNPTLELNSTMDLNSTLTINSIMDLNPPTNLKGKKILKLSTTLPLNSILKLFLAIFIFNATIDLTTAANNPAWKHKNLQNIKVKQLSPQKQTLHYENPYKDDIEIAEFSINLSDIIAIDKNTETDEEIDYHIDLNSIVWELDNTEAGEIDYDKELAIFTPNSNTCHAFKIKATVKAKDTCYETNKEHIEEKYLYSQPISTFKVGIKFEGGIDTTVFEDRTSDFSQNLSDTLSSLSIDWSGLLSTGKVQKLTEIPTKNIKWKTIARSGVIDLSDIGGKICFIPLLIFDGKYSMYGAVAGFPMPNIGNNMEIILTAFTSGPVKTAIAQLTINLLNMISSTRGGAAIGSAIINEIAEKQVRLVNMGDDNLVEKNIDFSTLTIVNSTVSRSPNYTINGSYAISAKIVVDDCGFLDEMCMYYKAIKAFSVKVGCRGIKYVK